MIQQLLSIFVAALPAAHAANDSVGVFTNPGKTVVLVQERGAQSRLHDWMNAWGAADGLRVESKDQSFNMRCARVTEAVSCTFKFLPSEFTEVTEKGANGAFVVSELTSSPMKDIRLSFDNSRGQSFAVSISDGILTAVAAKP